MEYVEDIKLVDTGLLPDEKEVGDLLRNDIEYENRMHGIILGYQKKIALLERLQRGEKIYKYGY